MASKPNQSPAHSSEEIISLPPQKKGYYNTYVLRCWQGQDPSSGDLLNQRFILKPISGTQDQQTFDSFEQVINFLLDELLDPNDSAAN